jgi:glycyl-tRNA synthetase
VLRLDPRLAPVKAAVLPLSRNADLSPKARDLAALLRKSWNVDFDTLEDDAVTVRERDTMSQERIGLDSVERYLKERLPIC